MKVYRTDSKVELTHNEALNLRSQIERAQPTLDEELEEEGTVATGNAQHPEPNTKTVDTTDFAYLVNLSAEDAIAVVNGLITAEEVQAAIDVEAAGKNRKSVISAAKDRLVT